MKATGFGATGLGSSVYARTRKVQMPKEFVGSKEVSQST